MLTEHYFTSKGYSALKMNHQPPGSQNGCHEAVVCAWKKCKTGVYWLRQTGISKVVNKGYCFCKRIKWQIPVLSFRKHINSRVRNSSSKPQKYLFRSLLTPDWVWTQAAFGLFSFSEHSSRAYCRYLFYSVNPHLRWAKRSPRVSFMLAFVPRLRRVFLHFFLLSTFKYIL